MESITYPCGSHYGGQLGELLIDVTRPIHDGLDHDHDALQLNDIPRLNHRCLDANTDEGTARTITRTAQEVISSGCAVQGFVQGCQWRIKVQNSHDTYISITLRTQTSHVRPLLVLSRKL